MKTSRLLIGLTVFCGVVGGPMSRADISLRDATDQQVNLPEPAQRIISLAPHITESVFAVGAGDKLVGVVNYSDYPEQALAIPRVGTYKKVNMEHIAGLQPDLILAFGSGNGYEMIYRLRALGFTVYVEEPRSLDDVAKSLEHISELAGTSAIGMNAANRFREEYRALKATHSHRRPVTVFYEVWNQPLLTVNGEHLISHVIRLCGGRNIFSDARPLVPKISVEAVVRRDPQVIIASGMGEERPEWLDEWRTWKTLSAVANGYLYFIPPDILQRHTPRILDGAKLMCRYLDEVRSK